MSMCVACSCDPLARATHVSTRTMVSPLGDVRLVLRVVADNAGEFRDWLEQELATWPFASLVPGLLARVLDIVLEWRRALPALAWRRLWRGNRILKEINEVMPAALQVVQWTDALAGGTRRWSTCARGSASLDAALTFWQGPRHLTSTSLAACQPRAAPS